MINKINLYFLLMLSLSCSQKKDDINNSVVNFQSINYESDFKENFEIEKDSSQFWVLKNEINDTELLFELYSEQESLPFDKWVFNLTDSNEVKSYINYEPSCGMGLSIIDTTVWITKKNDVYLTIKGYQIGYSKFEYNYHCRKESINDYNFKLIKI